MTGYLRVTPAADCQPTRWNHFWFSLYQVNRLIKKTTWGYFFASCFTSLLSFCLLWLFDYSGLRLSHLHQLPAQMGSLLGSSLALQYLNCVQDESAVLRFNFWLGYALHEGEEKPLRMALDRRHILRQKRPWVEPRRITSLPFQRASFRECKKKKGSWRLCYFAKMQPSIPSFPLYSCDLFHHLNKYSNCFFLFFFFFVKSFYSAPMGEAPTNQRKLCSF